MDQLNLFFGTVDPRLHIDAHIEAEEEPPISRPRFKPALCVCVDVGVLQGYGVVFYDPRLAVVGILNAVVLRLEVPASIVDAKVFSETYSFHKSFLLHRKY